jgi:hypothetical protein
MVTLQFPVPLQAPPQPPKLCPAPGFAVNVTTFPALKLWLQVPPQLIPAGLLFTVPVPAPAPSFATVNGYVESVNLAFTDLAALIVTEHAPVPVQAPLHPAKVDPAPAVAVSVTTVPLAKFALHVPGQLIPGGLLVTVPLPVPARETVSGKF